MFIVSFVLCCMTGTRFASVGLSLGPVVSLASNKRLEGPFLGGRGGLFPFSSTCCTTEGELSPSLQLRESGFTVEGVLGVVTENSMVAKKLPVGASLLSPAGLPDSLGVPMAAEAAVSSAVKTGVNGT
jgi:hypothetical protein